MRITITKEVFQKFHPQFRLAIVHAESIDNASKVQQAQQLLQKTMRLVQLTFNKDSFKSHHLIAPWEAAKREFGEEARHYQTSLEQLLRHVLSKKPMVVKNTLQGIVYYLSLKYLVPIAADDRARIQDHLTFALATGKERCGKERLAPGIVYYRDQHSLLGTKLDFWKNPRTALTASTTSALLHIEALPPITNKKINEVAVEAVQLIQTFCGGTVKVAGLDQSRRTVKI